MGRLDETRFIERQQFFNGQRLFASDLQGLEAFHREMRWLHNQSLHQPGVGRGLAVSGREGDRQLSIGPGYAIDAWGREIVLTQDWVEPVPPVAGENDGTPVFYDLTVSYPNDAYLEEAETRAGVCLPRGVVRLREEPVFCWVRLKRDDRGNLRATKEKLGNDIKNGLKIVVARAEVLNCQLNSDIAIAQRRSARPAAQPYVACGVADPTVWEPWWVNQGFKDRFIEAMIKRISQGEVGVNPAETGAIEAAAVVDQQVSPPFILPAGITAKIDTSQAGFQTTPHYTARISGSRLKEIELEGGEPGEGPPPEIDVDAFLVEGLVNINQSQPDSFVVNALLMVQPLDSGIFSLNALLSLVRFEEIAGLPALLEKIQECLDEGGGDEEQIRICLEKAVKALIQVLGLRFLSFFFPNDWTVVWMGVEG